MATAAGIRTPKIWRFERDTMVLTREVTENHGLSIPVAIGVYLQSAFLAARGLSERTQLSQPLA